MIQETIDLMGRKAKDTITGYDGVITSVSFDLYGCVQAVITPPAKPGEELKHGHWFDVQRLIVETGTERVMAVPDFKAVARKPEDYTQGAQIKPLPGQ